MEDLAGHNEAELGLDGNKKGREIKMTVYLVWCGNDEMEDSLVGIADTIEQAKKMKTKLKSVFDDAYEYHIERWVKNQVTIDDTQYKY